MYLIYRKNLVAGDDTKISAKKKFEMFLHNIGPIFFHNLRVGLY